MNAYTIYSNNNDLTQITHNLKSILLSSYVKISIKIFFLISKNSLDIKYLSLCLRDPCRCWGPGTVGTVWVQTGPRTRADRRPDWRDLLPINRLTANNTNLSLGQRSEIILKTSFNQIPSGHRNDIREWIIIFLWMMLNKTLRMMMMNLSDFPPCLTV